MQALDVISTEPSSLQGSEMIFVLTTSLQDVLENATKTNSQVIPTLEEERISKLAALSLKAREEEERLQVQASQVEEAGGTEEEIRLLADMAEQEKSRSAQRKLNKLSSTADQSRRNRAIAGAISFDQSSSVRDPSGRSVDFDLVCNKVFYRKSPIATISTVRIWQEDDDLEGRRGVHTGTAPFMVLKECFISSTMTDERMKKAIQALETKLDQQTRGQTSHASVIKPLNYMIRRSEIDDDESASSGWTVIVLMELASKGSLLELLEVAGQLDIRKVRAWALQILEGLHHYHQHGSAHASVHLHNVLLEQGEAENFVAKLSDGIYERELHLITGKPSRHVPLSWQAPEQRSGQTDVSITVDMWDFGICLVQMGFGKDIAHEYRSPAALLDDLPLSKSFAALLRQVFNINPKKRPSTWDALHLEFFRNDDALLEHQSHRPSTGRQSVTDLSSVPTRRSRRESTAAPGTSRHTFGPSRYADEFVEDGRLGRGGFGEVFRARNRIDGQLYAIKKIKARSRGALDPVLSEASVLSRLNHPNVVRYYASWIEDSVMIERGDYTGLSDEGVVSSFSHFGRGPILPPSSRVSFCHFLLGLAKRVTFRRIIPPEFR